MAGGGAGSFTDALVVFYDNKNNFISKTIVTEHDKQTNYIEISEGLEDVRVGTRLSLLIVHSDGASEFGGILKRVRSGRYEVSLFSERQRDARASVRHTLRSPAVIHSLVVNSKQQMLSSPAEITIVNISTSGVLLHSQALHFPIGCVLQVEFNVNGKNTIIYAKIVREQQDDDGSFNFGCQLIFLK